MDRLELQQQDRSRARAPTTKVRPKNLPNGLAPTRSRRSARPSKAETAGLAKFIEDGGSETSPAGQSTVANFIDRAVGYRGRRPRLGRRSMHAFWRNPSFDQRLHPDLMFRMVVLKYSKCDRQRRIVGRARLRHALERASHRRPAGAIRAAERTAVARIRPFACGHRAQACGRRDRNRVRARFRALEPLGGRSEIR
ncbi:MAG: hypothetical protein JWM91_1934 [Rhodospirillales bacterium]|nr:hypothetical protein [Rhodospirillales bacterium]